MEEHNGKETGDKIVKKFNFHITTLDRYIIKKFIGTYLFAILIIIGVAIIFDISEKIDDFVDSNAPLGEIIFDYYLNFIPWFINAFSSLFVFITVIFFTSKMAANTEIIAILAGGVSFKRLLYPYFISATVIFIFSLLLNLFVIPPANKVRIAFVDKYVHDKFQNSNRNMHYQISPGTYLYAESFSTWNNTIYKFTLESMEGHTMVSKLSAPTAQWDTTSKSWKLTNYVHRKFINGTEIVTTGSALDTTLNITVADFYRGKHFVETLNYRQLKNLIKTQEMRGDQTVKLSLIEKHSRYAIPFSVFILTVIAVSLSSHKRRAGIGMNIGIGLGLGFSYILFLRFSQMFVYTDTLPPIVAIWLPNFLYAIIAYALYKIAPK